MDKICLSSPIIIHRLSPPSEEEQTMIATVPSFNAKNKTGTFFLKNFPHLADQQVAFEMDDAYLTSNNIAKVVAGVLKVKQECLELSFLGQRIEQDFRSLMLRASSAYGSSIYKIEYKDPNQQKPSREDSIANMKALFASAKKKLAQES